MKNKTFLLSPPSFYQSLILFLFLLLTSCEKEAVPEILNSENLKGKKADISKTNTFTGPAEPFGNGVVKAFVTMNRDGSPEAIGVSISEKVLEDLPHEHQILTLRLPNKTQGLTFDHIDLDWNPHGHPPFFYQLPHFDAHFYMISEEEKAQIMPMPEDEILTPDEVYVPAGYFLPAPEIVPNMGMHWLNSSAPELFGKTFTHTFIYGSFQEDFIFYEPMITLDYLTKHADGTDFPIAQPSEFQNPGNYYPTSYSIEYDAKKKAYLISLDHMVLRE